VFFPPFPARITIPLPAIALAGGKLPTNAIRFPTFPFHSNLDFFPSFCPRLQFTLFPHLCVRTCQGTSNPFLRIYSPLLFSLHNRPSFFFHPPWENAPDLRPLGDGSLFESNFLSLGFFFFPTNGRWLPFLIPLLGLSLLAFYPPLPPSTTRGHPFFANFFLPRPNFFICSA